MMHLSSLVMMQFRVTCSQVILTQDRITRVMYATSWITHST
ncbi:hypothetical protein [Acinetobacter radioresistens]|nr:hypothetical protein [Acinetobacter radioresistens]